MTEAPSGLDPGLLQFTRVFCFLGSWNKKNVPREAGLPACLAPALLRACDQDQSSTSPSRRAKAVQHATTKFRAHRVGSSRTERVVQD
jgi:hypothetical protein